uniref:Uncharacterized protein n=1 Tax=Heliothis virescens TaxID=7102 RepID=A0A2A4JFM6_HELVI
MRVLCCVLLFVLSDTIISEARADDDDDEPPDLRKQVDVYPEHFARPVPFGHIPLQGFGDPFSNKNKQPIDMLELMTRLPKSKQEAREILKKGGKDISLINIELAKSFAGPRDDYVRDLIANPPPETNETRLKWYDLAEMQTRNAMRPPDYNFYAKKLNMNMERGRVRNEEKRGWARTQDGRGENRNEGRGVFAPLPPMRDHYKFFGKNSFQLHGNKEDPIKWTTCDEFAVGAIFSAKDIINHKWTPFYIWSTLEIAYATVHTFEPASKKVVNEYYTKYNKFLNKTVDWTKPKILMKGINEMLLIAVDRKGLFDALAKHEIPDSAKTNPITIPSLSLRMKIEDPYLVMMFCEEYYATIMAISGQEPTTLRDIKAELATIKFVGKGRPVWRDYEGEKEKIKLEQEAKIQEERDKYLN